MPRFFRGAEGLFDHKLFESLGLGGLARSPGYSGFFRRVEGLFDRK